MSYCRRVQIAMGGHTAKGTHACAPRKPQTSHMSRNMLLISRQNPSPREARETTDRKTRAGHSSNPKQMEKALTGGDGLEALLRVRRRVVQRMAFQVPGYLWAEHIARQSVRA